MTNIPRKESGRRELSSVTVCLNSPMYGQERKLAAMIPAPADQGKKYKNCCMNKKS